MNKTSIFLLCILVLSTIPLASASEESDWLGTWQNRVTLTISFESIDEVLTDFPLLLNISSSMGIGAADLSDVFLEVLSDYNAIAITNITQDQLYYEVEYWNATEQQAYLWFKAPTISNTSDTIFYLYYDSEQDGSAYNVAANVWNENFVMVQHMNDNPDTSHIKDSTSNDNDGTKKGANEPIETDGQIGKAQDYDGIDDYVNAGNAASVNVSSAPFSVNAYMTFKSTSASDQNIVTKGAPPTTGWRIWRVGGTDIYFSTGNGVTYKQCSFSYATIDEPILVTAVFDGSFIYIYKNGNFESSLATDTIIEDAGAALMIGALAGIYSSNITIDEIQLYADVWSSAWVGASYQTQRDNLLTASNFEVIPEEITLRSLVFMALALAITAIALIIVGWKEMKK